MQMIDLSVIVSDADFTATQALLKVYIYMRYNTDIFL